MTAEPTFADLGLPAHMVRDLASRQIIRPFPIQSLALPPALSGRDVCGQAPTGSGKTLAFGLALACRLPAGRPGHPAGLVLAPTRELAAQIERELKVLLGTRRAKVASFYGGVGYGGQLAATRRAIDVAVACPGRLEDLIARRAIFLDEVSMVVLDEADRMADMGFLPAMQRVLALVPARAQTLLFSATLDSDVNVLVRSFQRSPTRVSVPSDEVGRARTTHRWLEVAREQRTEAVAEMVKEHGSTVVFCRTRHGADHLSRQLVGKGLMAVPLHGGRSQAQRDRALTAFGEGRAEALVATDVAARGLHVDGVRCVVHFDLPASEKDFVHRSGRTARAGETGVVVTLVTEADQKAASALYKKLGRRLGGPGQ